jgi:uncharacterized membrane protein YfcA
MLDLLSTLQLTPWQWVLAACSGLVVGASKAGLAGMAFLAFPILAGIFGTRISTGVALPMLLIADVFAVYHYNRHADWRHLARLMPWVMAGLFIALIAGKETSDRAFGILFAVTLLTGIALMLWRDLRRKQFSVPDQTWFSGSMGMSAGFATMIGNAAGPMMSLYLLSMKLPKTRFIGTGAWFYFIVNIVKVPLHLFVWRTISPETIAFNLYTAPFILLGMVCGIAIVKRIPEGVFRALVMTSVTLAAVLLIVKFLF